MTLEEAIKLYPDADTYITTGILPTNSELRKVVEKKYPAPVYIDKFLLEVGKIFHTLAQAYMEDRAITTEMYMVISDLLEIERRDLSSPKYDGYFKSLRIIKDKVDKKGEKYQSNIDTLDESLGTINQIATKLAALRQHDLAIPLAEAVEKIESWMINKEAGIV